MKDFLKSFLLPFLGFVLILSIITPGIAKLVNVDDSIVFSVILILSFTAAVVKHKKAGDDGTPVVKNGVEVEIWANYIIERLWKQNKFLEYAFSDDDKVLAGKVVHIPQPGAKPQTRKNRNIFPATAVRRADSDITYVLDEYTTDPTHIPDAEKVQLSYDKIDSVYGDHAGQIAQDVADDAILKWLTGLPQTSIIKTTGAATQEILLGATGQRKTFDHKDLKKGQRMFNVQNIPDTERYALLSANMADELFDSLSATQYRDFTQYADAANGTIGRLYGFDIMTRSSIATASLTGGNLDMNPWGSVVNPGDRDVSMVWQKGAVARAMGEVKFFENPDRAEYYGDVYSSLLRFGGRRRRADNFGIAAIIQDIPA